MNKECEKHARFFEMRFNYSKPSRTQLFFFLYIDDTRFHPVGSNKILLHYSPNKNYSIFYMIIDADNVADISDFTFQLDFKRSFKQNKTLTIELNAKNASYFYNLLDLENIVVNVKVDPELVESGYTIDFFGLSTNKWMLHDLDFYRDSQENYVGKLVFYPILLKIFITFLKAVARAIILCVVCRKHVFYF